MPRERRVTLGRRGFFKRLCGMLAPSRVRQPFLGEISDVDVPNAPPSAPSWMVGSDFDKNLDEISNCPLSHHGAVVTMVALSGETVWGPRRVPNNIVFGNLRRLVSQDLAWPPDSLTMVHSARHFDLCDRLDVEIFGTNVQFHLVKKALQEPVAQGLHYGPGMYRLTDDVIVGSGLSTDSQDLHEIPFGSMVRISVAMLVEEEKRIRGRIFEYTLLGSSGRKVCQCDGWISLSDTNKITWVRAIPDAKVCMSRVGPCSVSASSENAASTRCIVRESESESEAED